MIVREAMVSDPPAIAADAVMREVAELLARPNVRSVLVVDGERLVGCATADSIVSAVARGVDLATVRARELADGDVATVGPDEPLDEAFRLMGERGLGRLPVTEDGRLIGVLPREPLVRRIAEDEPPAADDEPLGFR